MCKCLLGKGGKLRPICCGYRVGLLQEMQLHNVELKRVWGLVIHVNEQGCVHLGMEQKNFFNVFQSKTKMRVPYWTSPGSPFLFLSILFRLVPNEHNPGFGFIGYVPISTLACHLECVPNKLLN